MQRSIRGIFLSVAVNLLIIHGALAGAYRHAPTGITFPDRIATLVKGERVMDFETESPGLGIGIGYTGPGVKVTVYIYNLGMKAVPANLKSSLLHDQIKQATDEVLLLGKMGYYSNVKKISEDEVAWGDTKADARSLHVSFSYDERGRDRSSHLYLLGFSNYFIKVRFTYDKEIRKTAETLQKDFLREFSSILGGIGKKMHKQGN